MKKIFRKGSVGLLFCLALNSTALAEEGERHKQFLQEVFQSAVVYPQQAKEVQLIATTRFRASDRRDRTETKMGVEFGITDAWQMELEWAAFVNRDPAAGSNAHGIGDLEIGTKYSFMNIADWDFHAATGFNASFPLGDINKDLTEGFVEYEPFLVLAKDLPSLNNAHLFTHVEMSFLDRSKRHEDPDEDEPGAHEIKWNTGFVIPFGQLRGVSEFNWKNNEWSNGGTTDEMYITPGIVWDLPGTWEAGVGIPVGLTNDADNWRLVGHLIYEFDV